MSTRTLLCFLTLSLAARAAPNDPPVQIPYTGYLQQNGAPANGFVRLDLALFDPVNLVTPIWNDSYSSVAVSNGRFNITLGGPHDSVLNLIDVGYLNGTKGSGQPLQLQLTVNNVPLSPKQTLFAAPYANASGTANHSPTDFGINGGLTFSNLLNRAISFLAPGDAVNGISYRPSGAPDALAISGAGTSVGQRLLRLYDNVIVNGTLNATSDISTSGKVTAAKGVAPDVDTGWFAVHADLNDGAVPPKAFTMPAPAPGAPPVVFRQLVFPNVITVLHNQGFTPSHIAVESCGKLSGGDCATTVILSGGSGYHDSGSDINPAIVYSDTSNIYLSMVWNWWVWATYNGSAWSCAGNDDGNCVHGYMRVRAWR